MPDKILVIDDNQDLPILLKSAFSHEYEVIAAGNGKEGIDLAHMEMPDIIFMDVKMPVMDGIKATRILKDDPRTRCIPIIVITAMDESEDDKIVSFDAGADDYIEKPFNFRTLEARMKAHLRAKHLYDSLEQSKRDQEIILDVTRRTSSSINLVDVLHAVTEKVAVYLKLDRCSVVLVDEVRNHGLVVASNDAPDIGGLCIYLDKYPEITKVMETMKPLIVNDVGCDPLMAEVKGLVPYKSLMVIPILFREEVIGTFLLKADKRNEGFTAREAELCTTIANSSANAIKNASLYQKLEEKNQELERANCKLLELDRLKSNFIAMAAHELRSPINIVNGYLEMLIEGIPGPLSPTQLQMAVLALESNSDLASLVKDMLDISIIESQRLPLELKKQDVGSVVSKAVALVQMEAEKRGIKIKFEINPAEAVFDGKKINQVMLNFIGNALKFTPSGGEISVRVLDGVEETTISVSDTGQGIPKKDLQSVFDEFFKVSGMSEEGVGLGLPICKRLVELHRGRIWVESDEGKGSSFYFTLPKKGVE